MGSKQSLQLEDCEQPRELLDHPKPICFGVFQTVKAQKQLPNHISFLVPQNQLCSNTRLLAETPKYVDFSAAALFCL